MLVLKVLAPLAVALGLVAATSASAAPPAHVAGGDVGPLTYPSIVNVPVVRAQKALNRAIHYNDKAQPDKAVAQLKVARNNLSKAWAGARYVIEHAPPPPVAGDDAIAGSAVAAALAGP